MSLSLEELTVQPSSVYGPVESWRLGKSLGVDLLLQTSICSFNCIYCQLGDIQRKTIERKIYVSTDQVERDLRHSAWEKADIITLSGNGEPTLALNLGEVIHMLKEYTGKPVMVLTNGTLLHDPAVRRDLLEADTISIKLDAADDVVLQRMNRPVPGVTLASILAGAEALRKEYSGKLCLQCMFMPGNLSDARAIAGLMERIHPDEVQLNTPKRPYPLEWHVESRGNHGQVSYPAATLRVVTQEQADEIERIIRENTSVPLISVYRKS